MLDSMVRFIIALFCLLGANDLEDVKCLYILKYRPKKYSYGPAMPFLYRHQQQPLIVFCNFVDQLKIL